MLTLLLVPTNLRPHIFVVDALKDIHHDFVGYPGAKVQCRSDGGRRGALFGSTSDVGLISVSGEEAVTSVRSEIVVVIVVVLSPESFFSPFLIKSIVIQGKIGFCSFKTFSSSPLRSRPLGNRLLLISAHINAMCRALSTFVFLAAAISSFAFFAFCFAIAFVLMRRYYFGSCRETLEIASLFLKFKFKHTANAPYVLRMLYVVRISAKNQIAKTTK